MSALLSVVSIYLFFLPCAVFSLTVLNEESKAGTLLLIHIPISIFYFCLFQLNKAVPVPFDFFLNAILSLSLLTAVYQKLFDSDFLPFFLQLSMVMAVPFLIGCICIFLCNTSFKPADHFLFRIAVSFFSGLFTSGAIFLYLSGIRHLLFHKGSLTAAFIPPAVILLGINCLLTLLNPAGVSVYSLPGFILISLCCTAAACYVFYENNLQEVKKFDVNDLLKRQLPFLNHQIRALEKAETALNQYKANADLSSSADEAYAENRTCLMNLFTEDPMFNSFFHYYAYVFEQRNVTYSFSIHSFPCLPGSDSLLLFLLSGLLEHAEETALLSCSTRLNIFTLRFQTEQKRKKELKILVQRCRMFAERMEILETITDTGTLCQAEIHMIFTELPGKEQIISCSD